MPASPPCTTGRTTRARPRMPTPSCAHIADSLLRARYAYGHIDQMPRDQALDFTDIDRVKRDYFAAGTAFEGLVTFGVNLRGAVAKRGAHLPSRHGRGIGARPAGGDSCEPGTAECRRHRGLRKARLARPQAAHLPLHPGARHRRRDHGADQHAAELCDSLGVPPRARRRSARGAAAHAQGRRRGVAVVRRDLDRAAQYVRDHAVHLEHGHPVEGARRPRACPRSASAR